MASSPVVHHVQQDFNLIALLNVIAEPVAGSVTPSAANVGKLYRNTATKRLEYVWDASTVVSVPTSGGITDTDVAAGAAIALAKLATNPLARANHTGTQTAATISDFDTQVRTSRLDQMAAPTADVGLGGRKATNAADAVANTDLTTLQQVTNLLSAAVNGQDWKDSVRVAALTNVNIASPGAAIDGVTMATGNRVLLAGQTTTTQNGIYIFNGAASAMTRATDADANAEVTAGLTAQVEEGTSANKIAILTTDNPIVIGTTPLAFVLISGPTSYVGSGSIQVSGNTISIVAGGLAIGEGGTGSTTAPNARTALNVARKGAVVAVPALTAGAEATIAHTCGTGNAVAQVRRVSDKAVIGSIGVRTGDATNVFVTADVAVGSGVLELVYSPIDG